MTAEVVVMNKYGLSMAADSAITSGSEGVQKVYNSATKLYPLTMEHPIGVMVYGSASFMEVPWDVIIKSYRSYLREEKLSTITDYFNHFIDFLTNERRFNNSNIEEIIVYRTFSDVLKRIVKQVEDECYDVESEKHTMDQVITCLRDCVEVNLSDYKQRNAILFDIDYHAFKNTFEHIVEEIRKELISFEIPSILEENLNRLAYEVVIKDYFSKGSTGFVLAGYGEQEIFPHLLDYRLEGFVFGRLKYKKQEERIISYTSNNYDGTAFISAFGQREMIDTVVTSIEPNTEDAIFNIIHEVLFQYNKQMEHHLGIHLSTDQVTELKELGNKVYDSIQVAVDEYKKKNFIQPLLNIIRALPPTELAQMTETLIQLTSFKRRVSRVVESVSMPADVAIITKGDGFIWVKRKTIENNIS
ncbi:hypothetical protein ACLIBH_00670 [Virgibacillus sp. W0430]|uniref:hypothetical protein n=1 Tax=Virgibacillus sp. W0430 TaxID=3391580 RepID=UPI003F474B0A